MMKKLILCFALASLMMVGCSSSSADQVTKLELNQSSTNGTLTTKMELVHDGKKVYNQNQESVINASSESTYEAMLTSIKSYDLDTKAKNYEGAEYILTEDKDNLKITETINIDLTKLSAEGYKEMTLGQATPEENYYIDYEQTIDNLESQGFKIVE